MTNDPKPGQCYARRWYDVERATEQRHARVLVVGMGEDKPLVGVRRYGDFSDLIMTRAALDDNWLTCMDATHSHDR